MQQATKARIGIFAASIGSMAHLAPTALLSNIASSFPDVSPALAQLIITLPNFVAIFVAVVVGQLSSVLYKRHVILGATALILVSGLLQGVFHNSIYAMLALSIPMGAAVGALSTDNAALICDYFEGDKRSTMMGLQSAFISGGGALLMFLAGQLGKTDWSHCFLAYLLYAVTLVIQLIFLPKGRLSEKAPKGAAKVSFKLPGSAYLICITGFVFFAFLNVYNTNISTMVQQVRHLGGPNEASYAATIYNVAGMVAGVVIGAITARIHKKVMGLSAAVGAVGLLLTFLSHSLVLTCLGGACAGASFAMFMPSGNFYAAEAVDPDHQARAISLYTSITSLGQAISVPVVNAITGAMQLGVAPRFLLGGLVTAAVAVVLFATFRDRKTA